jgi:hypothetical protein
VWFGLFVGARVHTVENNSALERSMTESKPENLQAHEIRKGSNVINPNPVETIKIDVVNIKPETNKENSN